MRVIVICILLGCSLIMKAGKLDSVSMALSEANHDTLRLSLINVLAWEYKTLNPDTAYELSLKGMSLAKSLSKSKNEEISRKGQLGLIMASRNFGGLRFLAGDYGGALKHFTGALKQYEELGILKGQAAMLVNIGMVYKNQSDYPNGLKHYFEALRISKELQDEKEIARTLGTIGVLYSKQEELDLALEYYNRALALNQKLGVKGVLANNYVRIGIVHGMRDQYDEAMLAFNKGYDIYAAAGNKAHMALTLGNIGIIWKDKGDTYSGVAQDEAYAKAERAFLEALEIKQELGNKRSITFSLGNLGNLYTEWGRYVEAGTYLDSALALAKEIGALELIQGQQEKLSLLYEESGDLQKAYAYYVDFVNTKDTLFNESKSKEIGKLEAKHEFESAEAERKRAEQEAAKLAAQAKARRDNLQYSGILIFLVFIFAGVFMIGKFSMPIRLAEGMIFFAFLLFFEFTLVLLDPYIEGLSGGAPAYKLIFNAALAALIFPLHSFFESRLKMRLTA